MYDDKCPTCPNYGGPCDCGASKYRDSGCLDIIGLLAAGFIIGALVVVIIAKLIK